MSEFCVCECELRTVAHAPQAYPGSHFTYCSCTTTHFGTGHMEGEFRFKDVNGDEFDAAVPRFHLAPPASIIEIPK